MQDVWAMLADCAPGYTVRETGHNWRVAFGVQVYPNLSKGKHGARKNPEIQIGQVKHMVRLFGIQDCAKRHIERLR